MYIEFATNSESSDINFVTKNIHEEVYGFGSVYPFVFFIYDLNAK